MTEIPLADRRESIPQIACESVMEGQCVLVLFRLGTEVLAVDARSVQEITPMAHLSTPSGLPSLLAGFLDLAHRPIPVIRLHRLLNLPELIPGLYTHILLLRDRAGMSVGWMVDRVTQIIAVRKADIMPVPESHCFRDCTIGILTLKDQSVSMIALDRVLLDKERKCVLEFQAMEQERLRELEPGRP